MYRAIDTEVWDDTWFADLEPDGKLLFLYLLTNRRTTACGAFEISVRMIVNETGIDADRVTELIDTFNPRVLWFKAANLIWVRNFFRRQYKNANEKQVAALRSSLAAFPPIITIAFKKEYPSLFNEESEPQIAYQEATDSLSIGVSPITITGEEEVTEAKQGSEEVARGRAVALDSPHGMCLVFLDAMGKTDKDVAAKWFEENRVHTKVMLSEGITPEQLTRFVSHERARGKQTLRLRYVKDDIRDWIASGEPNVAMVRGSPKPDPDQRTRDNYEKNLAIAQRVGTR
jgi:hypothetical protein